MKKDNIITSLDQLKDLAKGGVKVAILLNYGVKSVKDLFYYDDGSWLVTSHIDDTLVGYATDRELTKFTNIIKALKKRVLRKE